MAAMTGGISELDLMNRAGRAVVDVICDRFPPQPAAVLCGPGNNGGDGYVIAAGLKARGWEVWAEPLAQPATATARAAKAAWTGDTLAWGQGDRVPSLIVDALFGVGLDRPLPLPAAQRARTLSQKSVTMVAVDLPSGLEGNTGRSPGDVSFRADLTVTFHAKKPAHVLQPGQGRCGEVVVVDIGLEPAGTKLIENSPEAWLDQFPWPDSSSHKYARGRLAVVSGGAWNTGAARLSARAGLRAGAGAVTLLSPPEALLPNAAHLEAVMLCPFESDQDLRLLAEEMDSVVIGPAAGLTEATRRNTLALTRTGAALVIDADAITVFRDDPGELFSALDMDDVLTPHVGEFDRIFPGYLASAPERISAVRRAARKAGAIVLLKGADTVIAHPDGRAAINGHGSPWLATAGSGDVLAGVIAGLMAQGMDSFDAACAGAWIHTEAGDLHGPGLIAEDLPGLLPRVLKRLYGWG